MSEDCEIYTFLSRGKSQLPNGFRFHSTYLGKSQVWVNKISDAWNQR